MSRRKGKENENGSKPSLFVKGREQEIIVNAFSLLGIMKIMRGRRYIFIFILFSIPSY